MVSGSSTEGSENAHSAAQDPPRMAERAGEGRVSPSAPWLKAQDGGSSGAWASASTSARIHRLESLRESTAVGSTVE